MMDKEISTLVERLEGYAGGCEDKCLDFQALKFEAKEGEMRLYNDFRSYFFKSDPKNPKDPRIIHAAKQFCKMQGVPYSFFAKNPEYMKNTMVSCWLPTLKDEKAAVLGKLRKTQGSEDCIIRALLPVEFTNLSNAEVVKIVAEAIGDDFRLEFVIGDDRDDLILHLRLVSKEKFEVGGEQCSTGFSLICSELGAAPISVETMLFREASKAAMIASYSGESFFETNYEGIQPTTIRELFPRLVSHLKNQLTELQNKVEAARDLMQQKDDINELMRGLRLRKGLNDKFHTLLMQEIESTEVASRWDFVNRMAILAKDFDVMTRVRIEKAAGDLIGLIFEKA
jgi:hypothetical protein